ncbi:MAG: GTP-binding protein [Oscillospiraceae bacterium]|nr:GTP-binding protein [Oscillospiraceae bacterium]
MTKIDLITGMLGTGKTTFLKKYANYWIHQGKKIAILENDFGAVNVDMMMLKDLKSENCQLEMISGGCDADCHKRRFKTQLIALGMQHLDRILIEPSGIFDMDEFFDLLYEPPLDRWFHIGSILGIVDATAEYSHSEQMRYLFASELAYCNQLMISKWDAIQEDAVSDRILRQLNHALAEIQASRMFTKRHLLIKNWEDFTVQDYENFANAGYTHASYVKKFHMDDFTNEVHYFLHVRTPENKIREMLTAILHDPLCGKIYRIKGALPIQEHDWLKINAVREKIEISPVRDAQAVLIVIGENLNLDAIQKYITETNTDPEYRFI